MDLFDLQDKIHSVRENGPKIKIFPHNDSGVPFTHDSIDEVLDTWWPLCGVTVEGNISSDEWILIFLK